MQNRADTVQNYWSFSAEFPHLLAMFIKDLSFMLFEIDEIVIIDKIFLEHSRDTMYHAAHVSCANTC